MFKAKVLDIVRGIPKGRTMTYRDVAKKAGRPRAYRAVASVMAQNYDSAVPCHRVVRSDGTLGDYNRGGEVKKRALLIEEGAVV